MVHKNAPTDPDRVVESVYGSGDEPLRWSDGKVADPNNTPNPLDLRTGSSGSATQTTSGAIAIDAQAPNTSKNQPPQYGVLVKARSMLKEAVSWFWSYWSIKQDMYWRLKLLLPDLIDEAPETAGGQFLNNTLEEQAAVDSALDVISGNTKQAVQSRKRSQHVSTTSIKHREEFSKFKICFHKPDGKCATRVGKLDTAASANVMSQAVFSSLGMNMEAWDGPALKPMGNGDSLIPLGKLNIDWHVSGKCKTYTSDFAILEHSLSKDFDVLLGEHTMQEVGFYTHNYNVWFLGLDAR